MNEIMEILKGICPRIDFDKEKQLIDDTVLDSLQLMQIITELSDKYEIEVDADDIVPENFNSAEQIWTMIERKLR